jgi:hypothetical protein
MSRRLLTPFLLCCALSACRNGKAHGACDADGTCQPVTNQKSDAAVGGEPDAQIATNEVTIDAAVAAPVDAVSGKQLCLQGGISP